jgi:hypothetical protein|tara:strand:- start:4043 stop:4489 length:447 start_codon:yes stop_codon:yes gene_type:complete
MTGIMHFHFIGIVKGGYTTITDPDGKPRIICFSKKKTADKCIDYMSKYRSSYGVWPDMNLEQPVSRINPNINFKKRTPENIREYIFIEEMVKSQLDEMSTGTGVCYFYCHTFAYKDDLLRISLSGQKIDGEIDDRYYKSRLDTRLKNV